MNGTHSAQRPTYSRPCDPRGAAAAQETLDADVELMLRVKEGDRFSYTVLLEKYRFPVQHFIYRKVKNRALAEELTQEVFLRVYRSRETYQPIARFKTWLFQIAAHLGSNSRRDTRIETHMEPLDHRPLNRPVFQIVDRRPSAEQAMVYHAKMDAVRQAVEALPEKQRTAVRMHKFAEMEYSEIARALGCSESAVKSLMFRAHERLRAALANLT